MKKIRSLIMAAAVLAIVPVQAQVQDSALIHDAVVTGVSIAMKSVPATSPISPFMAFIGVLVSALTGALIHHFGTKKSKTPDTKA